MSERIFNVSRSTKTGKTVNVGDFPTIAQAQAAMLSHYKVYVCKRARMCSFLIEKGFTPYKVAPDRDNPMYDVFLFTASPQLYEAVMEYINNRTERRANK